MSKSEVKAVFKIGLADKLLQLGNPIIRVAKNQHSGKAVFYFNGTEKLYRDLKWIENN